MSLERGSGAEWNSLAAQRLAMWSEKASPAPWRECQACHHPHRGQTEVVGYPCGLVWCIPHDFPIATTNTDSREEGFTSTGARKAADAILIARLRNAAGAISELLTAANRAGKALDYEGAYDEATLLYRALEALENVLVAPAVDCTSGKSTPETDNG